MNLIRILFNINIYLTAAIVAIAVAGDHLVVLCKSPILKALSDNITHAVIGGLSWSLCYLNREKSFAESRHGMVEILCCTMAAALIDLDHFFTAKSLSLKDATALNRRPVLHCSTLGLALVFFLLLMSYVSGSPFLRQSALILFTAFATHHLRDAHRRGLWFYPFGSTAPIPYYLYIALTCLVPYLVLLTEKILFKVSPSSGADVYSYVI